MFRITQQLFASQTINNARQHQAHLAQLQRQISSGLRIEKPSDDPAAVGTLLAAKAKDLRYDVDLSNIEAARARLNGSVSQLTYAKELLSEAHTIALAREDGEHQVAADRISNILEQVVEVANFFDNGQHFYGGAALDSPPFEITDRDASGNPLQVSYVGSHDRASVNVSPRLAVDTLYSGREVFQKTQRQETKLFGTTGATAGSGTDSATGRATLTVRHTSTTYAGGSGVQPGLSSADGDTIIGPLGANVLTVDDSSGSGASGTISLNGGPEFAFSSTDTNLQVLGWQGEAVYVDMSNITPGFNGQVQIVADGTLSVDEGLSEVAIDFTANQVVEDAETGAVTYIDSSTIERTGTDLIEYSRAADVFQTLIALRDDFLNADDLPPKQWEAVMNHRLRDLSDNMNQILNVVGEQSVALDNLDVIQLRTEQLQLETRGMIGDVEGADIPALVVKLQSEQNLLQFTYASSVGLLDLSILDFIR